ncbi:MAG: PAS domain S-box protein [Desulfobacula sp.]|nr:PAS domain S-box protein [Desulfobacula sp.]
MSNGKMNFNPKEQTARIAEYERRLKQLAAEKSQLQLYADLINRLSQAKGIDNVSYQIISLLMGTLGGNNITLFYTMDDTWHSMDAFRKVLVLDSAPENDVREVLANTKNVFLDDETDNYVLEADRVGNLSRGTTWIIPLIVEDEAIGAVKMEGMLVVRPDMMDHLKPFINYASLVLKNEIENYSELSTAYDDIKKINTVLSREVDERKKVQKNLLVSEERFKNTFENALVGMCLTTVDNNFLMVNPALCRMLGYKHNDLSGKKISTFTHPDDVALWSREIRTLLDNKVQSAYFETRYIHKSGEVIWASIGTFLFRDVQQEPQYFITHIEDITRRKKMEEDKIVLENQLQKTQKMEAIGILAGGIAHDFNNLLFPIMGMAELLLEDLPQGSLEHENAQQILNAGKRGGDLVKQILAFSRQSKQNKISIRIQQVLKEVFKLTRSTIPSDIEIVLDIQTDCGFVKADPTQIHQIAMNLITNAYHAIEQSGGKIIIHLKETVLETKDLVGSPLNPGKYAMLSVSDSGSGIDTAIRDKIFDPYFTTKERGKGTGLGLAVVYGIVKEHGGDIQIDSKMDKGTTVTVFFPLIENFHKDESVKKDQTLRKGTEQILLVDDEKAIIQIEKQVLERLGYQVTSFTSSLEALEFFSLHPERFDLVVTDMTMPNLSGDQLSKSLILIKPDLPIIICTGFSERMNKKKAEASGIKGFLTKPVSMFEMAKKVRCVLDEQNNIF